MRKVDTFEKVRKFPLMTEEMIKELEAHVDTDISDCPPLTLQQLGGAKRGFEAHPECYS